MNEYELFKEFEEKFGFEAYEGIKTIFAKLHNRIIRLTKTCDKWKKECLELRKQLKN